MTFADAKPERRSAISVITSTGLAATRMIPANPAWTSSPTQVVTIMALWDATDRRLSEPCVAAPCGNDSNPGCCRVGVASGPDARGPGERVRIGEVGRLSLGQRQIAVDQHNLLEQGSKHQGICGRRPDVACANDHNPFVFDHRVFLSTGAAGAARTAPPPRPASLTEKHSDRLRP